MFLAVVYYVLGAGVTVVSVGVRNPFAMVVGMVLIGLGWVFHSQVVRQRRQVQAMLQMALDVAQKRGV